MANITWRSIYDLNRNGKGANIKDPNLIYPGQVLNLPNGSTYTVARGDTLTKIADNYNRNIPAPPNPQSQNNPPPADAAAGNSKPAENRVVDDGLVKANENNEFPPVVVVGNKIEGDDAPNKRQYNPLSKFSSSTYRLSLYALSADSYNSYFINNKWLLKDMELLVQSGGAASTERRNEFFDLDFYIDNLEITTETNGKESRVAGNVSKVRFQIFEPYAMTFPSRLVAAQEAAQKKSKIKRPVNSQTDAMMCPYLLVVRFYGYDEQGNVIVAPVDAPAESTYAKTDSQAAFERAFPIFITKVSFKLESKTTVYDIEARFLNEQIGYGLKRGLVTKPVSVVADTVTNAIGGQTAKNAKTKGLLDIINQLQTTQLTKPSKGKAKQKVADVYKVYIDPEIGKSLIVDQNFYSKPYAATALVDKVKEVNERTAFLKSQTVSKAYRQINIATGTSILSAIEQIIGQSTYLRDSMVFFDKEETQPTKPEESTVSEVGNDSKNTKKGFQWYIVKPIVKILDFDRDRQDYAYEITYSIQKYKVPYVRALAIQLQTGYYGPHKIYNYWYSGENTEVLSYEVTYNLLYYNTQVLSSEGGIGESQVVDTAPNAALPATDSSALGKLPGTQEVQNTVKTFLYSPADQIKATVKILGDPDFLMPVESGSLSDALSQWYGPDYSVNANTGQVFIEIGFNQVNDYDNSSGLLSTNSRIKVWDYEPDIETQAEGRMIFMVTRVLSKFLNGTFTQDLKLILPNFDKTKKPNQGNQTSREKVSSIDETNANIVATLQKNAVPIENNTNTQVAVNTTVGNNPTVNDDS